MGRTPTRGRLLRQGFGEMATIERKLVSHVIPGMQEDAKNKLNDVLKHEEEDDGLASAGVPATPKR